MEPVRYEVITDFDYARYVRIGSVYVPRTSKQIPICRIILIGLLNDAVNI
jgi:hypothetical protein